MRNRKCFIHGTLIDATFRTEEGLPFAAKPYLKRVLVGILAKAQTLYRVKICHAVLMSNHVHMLFVVYDPTSTKNFIEYVKRESAHVVNRLLGRRQRTVWYRGYDSPVILDSKKAIERIVHLYTNPQRAGLVDKIDDYPNLSTWFDFLKGGREIQVSRIPRSALQRLPTRTLSFDEEYDLQRELEKYAVDENTLIIEPDAWMDCFTELADISPDELKYIIIEKIRAEERKLLVSRDGCSVGAHNLRLQSIRQRHTPHKFGKRMICLASCKSVRESFIVWYRELCEKGTKTYRLWTLGDWRAQLPPGLFAPGGLIKANLNPLFAPL